MTAAAVPGPRAPHPADAGPSAADWDAGLAEVLAGGGQPALHAQPIVDLTAGTVAGYELLARFTSRAVQAPPDAWFAAAQQRGLSAALQARVLTRALERLDHLPPATFLSVNLDPDVVDDPAVLAVLTSRPRLGRLVLELTEHSRPADLHVLDQVVAEVRARGALVAVDDAGTGYAGLTQLLRLRPDIVKVDRELVRGVDADPVKRAMVAMLGDLAGRMDAWVLTEGIETRGELEVLLGLGVPLGQGYYLARPEPRMALAVREEVVDQVLAAARRTPWTGHVVSLLRTAATAAADAPPDPAAEVLIGADGRPTHVRDAAALRARAAGADGWRRATVVAPSTTVAEAAVRAVARPPEERWLPLVCTDAQGWVLGVVTVHDLVVALAATAEPP